jgi:penicillin-binding protein 1B
LGFILLGGTLLSGLALGAYLLYLDDVIRAQFEGKRWALPARVYARPLELFPGMPLDAESFIRELKLLRYRRVTNPDDSVNGPGTYSRRGDTIEVFVRGFAFWDGHEPARPLRLRFQGQTLAGFKNLNNSESLGLVRMEPMEIAGIYPAHQEDRIFVKYKDIPPVLIDALIAMEDQDYYSHFGIDPKGIVRAFWVNLRAGRTVQGGSTLTQQLVKNFFLTNERTLKRKFTEACMAMLVEWRYSKSEILEAYSNEVYLGQDGSRAIHGLGLASRFYFDRPLTELDLHHVALLVGLVNGPSKYDPRRYPDRAKQRRALVLNVMVKQGLIDVEDAAIGKQKPLDVSAQPPSGITRYPSFLDLVQRQLQKYYRKQDLTSEGLQIFTTLDPQVQAVAEQAITHTLPSLEKARAATEQLQAATVVADTQSGEVLAIVGGRDVRLAGFNRALDAQRPAGSLLKPAIYLTALERPGRYTLATLLDDSKPVVYTDNRGRRWSPDNYDKRFHGQVILRDALANSYNIPAARLGLELDVLQVIDTLQRLGIERELKPYPSILLGAVDLSPLEVAQLFETFASGGFRTPLRAIREVTDTDGEPLQRYPLQVEKVIEPGPAYLITNALQQVVVSGTASALKQQISPALGIAGKTGTTNDFRDSWFTGFSGNRLAVVWLGRDDNKPIGLSGSKGALRVWMNMMSQLNLEPLRVTPPLGIETALIDPHTGLLADSRCADGQWLPFLSGSLPRLPAPCSAGFFYSGGDHRAAFGDQLDSPSSDRERNPDSSVGYEHKQDEQRTSRSGQTDPITDFFKRLLE